MEKQKNALRIGLIYIILLGVFNLMAFVIPSERNSVFWLSYIFITAAFIVQLSSLFLAFWKADVASVFFGIPLASLSVYYLGAAVVVGTIFMLFQRQAGFTLALILQVLLLAAYSIVAILSIMTREAIQDVSANLKTKAMSLKSVAVEIELLLSSTSDPELSAALRKLLETVKYSDPMINEAVADVEEHIHRKIGDLKFYCWDNRVSDAKQVCVEMLRLYDERNRKLLVSK